MGRSFPFVRSCVCGFSLVVAQTLWPSCLMAGVASDTASTETTSEVTTTTQVDYCKLVREERRLVQPTLVQSWSQFGSAVAVDGPWAVIGARGEDGGSGSLYVYQQHDETWQQYARLKAGDGGLDDLFGAAVAVYDNLLIAGAPRAMASGLGDAGAVYLFEFDAGRLWQSTARLTAGDPGVFDHFGMAVGVWKNHVIVGAWNDDERGEASGSAYIYAKNSTGWWDQVAKLAPQDVVAETGIVPTEAEIVDTEEDTTPSSPAPQEFGLAVAMGKDFALVGAPGLPVEAEQEAVEAGAVYVFSKVGHGWEQSQILRPTEKTNGDGFGASLAVWDDVAVIGAPGDDSLGEDAGAAYVFKKDGNTWSQVTRLTAADGSVGDRFGISVAINGSHVAVGAIGHDGVGVNAGMTYIFEGLSSAWSQKLRLSPGFPSDGQKMGMAVALNSQQLLAGSDPDDALAVPEQVYDFSLSPLIRAEKSRYDFGLIAPESESEEVEIFLNNPGEYATTISSISLSAGDVGAFEIVKDRCTKKNLKPGRQCSIVARFTPDVVGRYEALMTVASDQCLALDVPLRGDGAIPGYNQEAWESAAEDVYWLPAR